jgi:hypothetical protein
LPVATFPNQIIGMGSSTVRLNYDRITAGAPTLLQIGLVMCGGPLVITGPATQTVRFMNQTGLNANVLITNTPRLEINGGFFGSSGLTLGGSGTLSLGGNATGALAGTMTVAGGTLELAKIGGNSIGAGGLNIVAGTARWMGPNQVADSASVSVTNSGSLADLNGFNDTIGSLTLYGAAVTTGTGTLTVNGSVTSNASSDTATIGGHLYVGSGNVVVARGSAAVDLMLSATVGTPGALTTSGAGIIYFDNGGAGIIGSMMISGGGTVRTAKVSGANLDVQSGRLAIDAGTAAVYFSGLTLASSGTLDLNDADLVLSYGTNANPFSDTYAAVVNGFMGSDSGTIISTVGRNNPNGNTIHYVLDNQLVGVSEWPLGSGISIDANSLIAKYTYFGDVNFDGRVDDSDYAVLDGNYGSSPDPRVAVLMGDANLSGTADDSDYAVLDGNFGNGVGNPLAPEGAARSTDRREGEELISLME